MIPPDNYQHSPNDADLLPVVDENDEVIGILPRREVHLQMLRHRAVHGVVVNTAGEVLLQLRSMKKDSCPGWWDISMGGHVDVDEDYDAAARREFMEELAVDAPVREVARREAHEDSGWEFVRIYQVEWDGPFFPNAEEVLAVVWVSTEVLFGEFSPESTNPARRITKSGLLSLDVWARATGRR